MEFLWVFAEDLGNLISVLPAAGSISKPVFPTFTRQRAGACRQSASESQPCFSIDDGNSPRKIVKKSQNVIRRGKLTGGVVSNSVRKHDL